MLLAFKSVAYELVHFLMLPLLILRYVAYGRGCVSAASLVVLVYRQVFCSSRSASSCCRPSNKCSHKSQ